MPVEIVMIGHVNCVLIDGYFSSDRKVRYFKLGSFYFLRSLGWGCNVVFTDDFTTLFEVIGQYVTSGCCVLLCFRSRDTRILLPWSLSTLPDSKTDVQAG